MNTNGVKTHCTEQAKNSNKVDLSVQLGMSISSIWRTGLTEPTQLCYEEKTKQKQHLTLMQGRIQIQGSTPCCGGSRIS